MRELPLALRRYLTAINVACLAMVVLQGVPFLVQHPIWQESSATMRAVAIFVFLAFASHRVILQVNRSVAQNLATSVHIAAILLFPPPLPLLITFLSSTVSETLRKGSPLYKRAFNVSHPTVTVGLCTLLCSQIAIPARLLHPGELAPAIPGLALLAAVFYLLDVGTMLGVLMLLQGRSPWLIWWQAYRHAVFPELAGSSIGVVATILWQFDPWAIGLVILPVVALRVAFSAIAQAEERALALRRRSEELEAVLTAGQRLRLQHTQADLLQPLAEAASTIVGAASVTGYLLDEENPALLKRLVLIPHNATIAGPVHLPVPASNGNFLQIDIEDVGRAFQVLIEPDGVGVAGLLLLAGDSISIGPDERDALAILATQAAIALENARLHERALAQASEDGLTGLLNHRAFQLRLGEEVARAQRNDHSLAVMMIDVDDFGEINNTYGHQIGDAALAAIAKTVQYSSRNADVVARYGGDEFFVILPETDLPGALAVAERVLSAIEALTVVEGGLSICVHASIGVAALPLHAHTREELVRAADHAAYAAKHAGKRCVCRPEEAAFMFDQDPVALATQLEHANLATVAALAAAVDAKDPYTRGHSQRVSAYATALAGSMGIPAEDVARIQLAGLLHDVGKIGVPDAILTKPSMLSTEEYAIIAQHPAIGEHMLSSVPFLRDILPAVRHHHERWDGQGYPDRLCGDAIPLDAAVLMVADSLDAMTSSRTYRPALPLDEARRRILEGKGTQFHPQVVAAFEQALANGSLVLLSSQPVGTQHPYQTEWVGQGAAIESEIRGSRHVDNVLQPA